MRVTLERNDLARLIADQNKIVESRSTIPILSTVRLVADGGKLTATMTDLDIEVSKTIAAEAEEDGAICVSASLLDSIVRKVPTGNEILLEAKDGTATIKSGRYRSTLHTLPVDDFPTLTAGTFATEFETDLSALLAPVQFSISTEETRYYLNGIYLHVDAGNLTAVATDGHRLARNIGQAADEFAGVIVPRKTVSILPKGAVTVRLSETKIQFEATDAEGSATLITSKLIDGTFPDYKRIMPTGNDKVVTFDVPAMKQAVERVSVISSERGRAVKLSFADNQAALAVNNADTGSATEEIAVGYEGEPLEIGFNSAYLTELVSQFPAGDVKMAMADSGSPTLFSSEKAEGLLCVLMPMRV